MKPTAPDLYASLRRVLDSSRSDLSRMLHRLRQLVASWDSDDPAGAAPGAVAGTEAAAPTP